jgi:hypothetical protein
VQLLLLRISILATLIKVWSHKSFTYINRDILWEIMSAMGYPSLYTDWIKTLNSITQLCPRNGSTIVGTINDVQSVRQGCPLSIHLFAIFLEPLLVRLADSIVSFDLHGVQVKVRACVDDLTVFVSSKMTSPLHVIQSKTFVSGPTQKLTKRNQAVGFGSMGYRAFHLQNRLARVLP